MVGYIKAYEPEAPAVLETSRPDKDWPAEGDIRVQKLVVRYRRDLPDVLKALTFHVHARHKVCTRCQTQMSMQWRYALWLSGCMAGNAGLGAGVRAEDICMPGHQDLHMSAVGPHCL